MNTFECYFICHRRVANRKQTKQPSDDMLLVFAYHECINVS